jgi:hypothetical protein
MEESHVSQSSCSPAKIFFYIGTFWIEACIINDIQTCLFETDKSSVNMGRSVFPPYFNLSCRIFIAFAFEFFILVPQAW